MSDLAVALVAEGPTDRIIVEAALGTLLECNFTLTLLQPDRPTSDGGFGELGSGWGGVYRWCRQAAAMGTPLSENPSLTRYQMIIVHLDADVAGKRYSGDGITDQPKDDLPCEKPCPPASDTVQCLQQVILGWLDAADLPQRAVFCIPSKCTESWVAVALYSDSDPGVLENLECNDRVAEYLAAKPTSERLVRMRKGRPKKNRRRYEERSRVFEHRWSLVESKCPQARAFADAVRAALAKHAAT